MHIDPEHVPLMRFFGSVLLLGGIASLYNGKTYFRRIIDKAEEPINFWFITLFLVGFGSFCLLGTLLSS